MTLDSCLTYQSDNTRSGQPRAAQHHGCAALARRAPTRRPPSGAWYLTALSNAPSDSRVRWRPSAPMDRPFGVTPVPATWTPHRGYSSQMLIIHGVPWLFGLWDLAGEGRRGGRRRPSRSGADSGLYAVGALTARVGVGIGVRGDARCVHEAVQVLGVDGSSQLTGVGGGSLTAGGCAACS